MEARSRSSNSLPGMDHMYTGSLDIILFLKVTLKFFSILPSKRLEDAIFCCLSWSLLDGCRRRRSIMLVIMDTSSRRMSSITSLSKGLMKT